MKTDDEMDDDFDFKAAGERVRAARKAALEARKPIVLEDWDKEITMRHQRRTDPEKPQVSKPQRESELTTSQKIEIHMLSNIISSECPSSLDQLDKYLADNKQKIHDAYMNSCSYKIAQVPVSIRNFFVGIVEAFNALVHQVNQLFHKPPKRQAEDRGIELQTFSKNEVEVDLPVAEQILEAEPLSGLHIVEQAEHALHPAIAQPIGHGTDKSIDFVIPSSLIPSN